MEYRIMEEADLHSVIPLYIEYYNAHEGGVWTEKTTAKRICQVLSREDAFCLLMEDQGTVIAFAIGYFEQYDDCFAYDLVEIVVSAERQNQGIGTMFMEELEKQVKGRSAMLIQLQAVNDGLHEHFYGKLGYRTVNNLVLKSKML